MNRPRGLSPKASIKEAPKLKLKASPSHLKYEFLGDNDTLLVNLSTDLFDVQVKEVLAVLKRRKKVIR